MGFVYQIVNDVNGKIYVGKTELYPPEKRWQSHIQDYKRRKCEKRPLYDAMNKYGVEHFHFSVIEETDNTCEREMYWIEKLRTYVGYSDCNGYNATLGGEGKCYLNLDLNQVIDYHINQANLITKRTAEYFGVDQQTIKMLLIKNNIVLLDSSSVHLRLLYEKRGFIYQVDSNSKIVGVYITTLEAIEKNPEFCKSLLIERINGKDRKGNENHFYKGYYWYNDSNIPDDIQEIVSL